MYPKEATLYRAIIIAAFIIGTIIVYFILSLIKAQRRFHKLKNKNLEAVITSIEKERGRIASDLHDELGPVLSAVKFKLLSIDVPSPIDSESMNQSLLHMDGIIKKIRAIAYNFTPSVLQHKGLLFAVEHYIQQYSSCRGLKIVLSAETNLQVPERAQIHIYRILQEIIHNTIKHADASILRIELCASKSKFFIRTSDDGIGFNYKQMIHQTSGQGLQNLRMRTEVLGGEIHINSKCSNGTRYQIQFPVN